MVIRGLSGRRPDILLKLSGGSQQRGGYSMLNRPKCVPVVMDSGQKSCHKLLPGGSADLRSKKREFTEIKLVC